MIIAATHILGSLVIGIIIYKIIEPYVLDIPPE